MAKIIRAKIIDRTKLVLAESDRLIKKKLMLSALLVERTAKLPGFCPVKWGTARRSIISNSYGSARGRSVSWKADKGKGIKAGSTKIPILSEKRALIGSNIEYFPFIELGTSKMPARAPLRRALETNMDRIKRLFGSR